MLIVIYTGDKEKCRVDHFLECPACGERFEILAGKFVSSSTLGEKVQVCPKHSAGFTADEEAFIQASIQKAVWHPRGHILRDGKLIKKSKLLSQLSNKEIKRLLEP